MVDFLGPLVIFCFEKIKNFFWRICGKEKIFLELMGIIISKSLGSLRSCVENFTDPLGNVNLAKEI